MALATITDITKAYQGRSIFNGLSFELQKGQKIGLIGPNGAGKTTLFKMLTGIEQPDTGEVAIAKSCRWSYVSQHPNLDPEKSLRTEVTRAFAEIQEIERQLHQAAEDLGKFTEGPKHDETMERYDRLQHEFEHQGGYDIQRRIEIVTQQLRFTERDLDLPIKALSGGQKSRAQIARLLLEQPDLMLLDEPTNHLDLQMLDWLENTLNEMTDATLVVISHDRYFLDSVVNEIWELQPGGIIEKYPGNYSAYIDLKAERQLSQQRAYDQQQAYIAKQEEYIRRFGAGQRAMQARGRKTRLERLKAESLVGAVSRNGKRMILNLKVQKTSGLDVLKTEGLGRWFPDKKLFENLDLHLLRGKRLGIIGPNGSGKSTLLNTVFGEQKQNAGEYKWGHAVQLRYYRQEHQDLNLNNTVIDELQSVRLTATQQELRDLAALFLFSGDTIEKPLGVLSGGEKSRVAMAKLLLQPTNTILMDEPTNHLDIATCEVLESALDSYDGTLILVSHDRYFMDQVCDMLLVFTGDGGWRMFQGSYTDYLATLARESSEAATAKREADKAEKVKEQQRAAAAKAAEQARKKKEQQKATGKPKLHAKYARMTVAQIEVEIAKTEKLITDIEISFALPELASNRSELAKLQATYDARKRDLEDLMAAWESKAAE